MLCTKGAPCAKRVFHSILFLVGLAAPALAQEQAGGEATLKLPDLNSVPFLNGISGHNLLLGGLAVSALGLLFGLMMFVRLRNMPVHTAMREVSELIYETCKTYLATQGKFLMLLELFIAVIIVFYFGFLRGLRGVPRRHHPAVQRDRHFGQLLGGGVRHAHEHLRQLAHGVRGAARQGLPLLPDSARSRHEHRDGAGFAGTADHAVHPAVRTGRPGRGVLHRLRHRRIAGRGGAARGGRHFHQDRGHRLGPDEDRLQDQGRRRAQPGRDRRLHGRQRGRFGGTLGGRFRNLRRDRRGADHVHSAGGEEPGGAGATTGLDLLHARDDGGGLRYRLLRERRDCQGALRGRGEDEFRGAAHHPGLADFPALHRAHLPGQRLHDSGAGGRHFAVVEALHRHQLRHAGGRADSGIREGVHLDQFAPRARDRNQLARRRRLAEHSLRTRGRQLQRLLAGLCDAGADEHRVFRQHHGAEHPDGGAGGVRVRAGGVRLPGHGAGNHRGGQLRSGDGQRAVHL